MKGPALYLGQFVSEVSPFDRLATIIDWAAGCGFRGVQKPTWVDSLFDLRSAAESVDYCQDVQGLLANLNVAITELSVHRQSQLVGVHPTYIPAFAEFAPPALRSTPAEWSGWAAKELIMAARATRNLGLDRLVGVSGALAWPFLHPWPPAMQNLAAEGLAELARRWRPILDAMDSLGVDLCFEIHPTTDLHDGASFERFLDLLGGHCRVQLLFDPSHLILQGIDTVGFVTRYRDRIRAVHVKDAVFRPDARNGALGGFQPWPDRAARYCTLGTGDVPLAAIFRQLAAGDYDGWIVCERTYGPGDVSDNARRAARFTADLINASAASR